MNQRPDTYKQFIFNSYSFDPQTKELLLHYSIDDQLQFSEKYRFDFPYASYDKDVLDRAIQSLYFLAGVSYYKTYIPPEIIVRSGQLDEQQAAFFSKTYQRGLGEYWYVNKLDPRTPVTFPSNTNTIQPLTHTGEGLLVGVGGGKDSLAAIEILRDNVADFKTWSLNHRLQLSPLVERIGLPHCWVEREWDPQLASLREQGALNGHVPISAIFACVGTIVAILSGERDIVTSNERSANEPTLVYEGVPINHQYSKSQEFEEDYQAYLRHCFGDSLRYYSFFRPLSEVKIGELFARVGFEKYRDVFSSCNRAYIHGSTQMSWCGHCPKCAFVFLVLTPFVDRSQLEALWGSKNLLLDPSLEPTYRSLLGIEGDKPLECIGEVKECRAAMDLGKEVYPELKDKYHYEIPSDYDYRHVGPHAMPPEVNALLANALKDV